MEALCRAFGAGKPRMRASLLDASVPIRTRRETAAGVRGVTKAQGDRIEQLYGLEHWTLERIAEAVGFSVASCARPRAGSDDRALGGRMLGLTRSEGDLWTDPGRPALAG